MNAATEKQIAFTESLVERLMAAKVEVKGKISKTYNPELALTQTQKIAQEMLDRVRAENTTTRGASNIIDQLLHWVRAYKA